MPHLAYWENSLKGILDQLFVLLIYAVPYLRIQVVFAVLRKQKVKAKS